MPNVGFLNGALTISDAATSRSNLGLGTAALVNTPIAANLGGTGVANSAASTITISGAFPLTATLTASTNVTFPTSGTLATTADIPSTPITVANGGTGRTSLTNHGVLVGATTSAIIQLAAGSAGQVLQSGGASADPAYSTATYPLTTTSNRILYSSSDNVVGQITSGNDGALITSGAGVPSISSTLPSAVQNNITALGTIGENFLVSFSSSGADVSATVSNTSNTASSSATLYATVAGTSAGDAQVQYAVSGTTTWTQGIDNSVTGDPYVIAASSALGTTNVMSATTAGEVNWPLQPAFSAYLSAQQDNKTGAGTVYTVICDTERFDQNGDYNNSTGVFTAPVTGRYQMCAVGLLQGCTINTGILVQLDSSNQLYLSETYRPAFNQNSGGTLELLIDMDAADTCAFKIQGVGEAGDTNDVTGGFNNFSGYLAC